LENYVAERGASVRPMDPRRLSRVLEFIDGHIDENVTVAVMAAVACMSPAHFARSFKATTGQSPHRFVSRKRLELAERMLLDPYRPLSEIALSAGFSSQSNFSRAFRNVTGMSPGDFRANRIKPGAQPSEMEHANSTSQLLNKKEQSVKSQSAISTIGSCGGRRE